MANRPPSVSGCSLPHCTDCSSTDAAERSGRITPSVVCVLRLNTFWRCTVSPTVYSSTSPARSHDVGSRTTMKKIYVWILVNAYVGLLTMSCIGYSIAASADIEVTNVQKKASVSREENVKNVREKIGRPTNKAKKKDPPAAAIIR